MDKKEEKKLLRRQIKDKRKKLSPRYCVEADEKIFQRLISLGEYQEADIVCCFVGTEQEVDTLPILKHVLDSRKRLGVPKCLDFGVMEMREIKELSELVSGAYGILEPMDTCPIIMPEEISFICVPCLTCTREGKRLGYGGGFYDRYLPKVSCKKAVLCRKELMVEDVPLEEHDRYMDYVITD